MSLRSPVLLVLAMALIDFGVSGISLAQGRAQGAIVIKDDAPIYSSDEGPKIIAKATRGYAVGGITVIMGMVKSYVPETENGRAHILYLGTSRGPTGAVKGSTEKNALRKRAWMSTDDLAFFTYECGCGEEKEPCAPVETAGWISERWNQCFVEARDQKLAELRAEWEKGGQPLKAPVAAGDSGAGEKALTNDDIVSLSKAGLGDEVIVSKIQQAPREALDVSVEALLKLKKNGLSQPVLDAMVKKVGQRK